MEMENVQPEEAPAADSPELPSEPAPLVSNRFLFVDIAALRAKQLRRGARPRIDHVAEHHPMPHKPERLAMEEVKQQKVYFDLPPLKPAGEAASER